MKKIVDYIKRYRPPKFMIYFIFLVPIVFSYIKNAKLDNDIWFLLNHGRYVFEHGIVYIEPFSIHNNLNFVMQQWLSSSIFWIIYKYFGVIGLRLLTSFILMLITFFTYKLCMLVSNKKIYLSAIITVFVTSILSMFYIVDRPQIFTYLILIVELYILELYIRNNNKKIIYILPILSILLINLHASMWLMLFLFMLPYLIDSFKIDLVFINGEGYRKKHLFICLILMIIGGFINPYGISAMTYLFGSYGISEINKFVGEMKVTNMASSSGKFVFLSIFLVIFIYMFYKKGKFKLRYILLLIGTTYLSLSSYKGFAYFIISSIFPIAYYIRDSFNIYVDKTKYWNKKVLIFYKVLCIILMIFAFVFADIKFKYEKPKNYNSVNYILKNYDKNNIKLYTGYNDGSYAEFMGLKCYIDPRAEVFLKANNQKDDIYIEYYNLQNRLISVNDFIEKYKFDVLLIEYNDVLNTSLLKYKIVYSDKDRLVYERINKG